MKKNKKLMIVSIIVFVVLFALLIIVLNSNKLEEQTVSNWSKVTNENYDVVTIIGSTTCPHCQEYKPVITALANKYKFKLFFFEVDSLTQEDTDILYNKYNLENFDGHVPYTFIIKNNKFEIDTTGFSSREDTIKFLKENNIIKN